MVERGAQSMRSIATLVLILALAALALSLYRRRQLGDQGPRSVTENTLAAARPNRNRSAGQEEPHSQVAMSSTSVGRIYYVSKAGKDSNTGSLERPFSGLAKALTVL